MGMVSAFSIFSILDSAFLGFFREGPILFGTGGTGTVGTGF